MQAAVAAVVGDRAEVRTPEAQGRSTQEIVCGLQIGFPFCSAGAMIVGLFLVYNALAVTVAERRHDIGILRSLGATRRADRLAVRRRWRRCSGWSGRRLGVPLGVGLARGSP